MASNKLLDIMIFNKILITGCISTLLNKKDIILTILKIRFIVLLSKFF